MNYITIFTGCGVKRSSTKAPKSTCDDTLLSCG